MQNIIPQYYSKSQQKSGAIVTRPQIYFYVFM